MGRGIEAAIPIILTPYEYCQLKEKHFARGFLDNFNIEVINAKKYYTIKEDLLISNYKTFLAEFYDIIEEDFSEMTNLTYDNLPDFKTLDEFNDFFNCDKREGCFPLIDHTSFGFDVVGCECEEYWSFYSGSYKAYLEVYTTLLHFEKILARAMKNPLANAVKFGIFG